MLLLRVKKRWPGFDLAIELSFEREVTALFGPSGSGKSTILNMIAGLVTPDEGEIRFGETVFYATGRRPVPPERRGVGYVFQDYALFPHMTVAKNIAYGLPRGKTIDDPKTRRLIAIAGIDRLLGRYPGDLSGGEKQRVAFVRALASEPKLILLDEPFSSLDQDVKNVVREAFQALLAEEPVPAIIVTHDHEEAERLADRIVYIRAGRVEGEKRVRVATPL
ncbi:MAG: ATP-binding cassette domain-containing protein [Hydrogenibacillus schlegelii]|nr:ATP-binding cassette domain-containing protein [Hydrogenibacillus schlegelii]